MMQIKILGNAQKAEDWTPVTLYERVPESMIQLKLEGVLNYLKQLGYYIRDVDKRFQGIVFVDFFKLYGDKLLFAGTVAAMPQSYL